MRIGVPSHPGAGTAESCVRLAPGSAMLGRELARHCRAWLALEGARLEALWLVKSARTASGRAGRRGARGPLPGETGGAQWRWMPSPAMRMTSATIRSLLRWLPGSLPRAVAWARRNSHVNLSVVDQALVSGVNFLIGIALARLLGAEEFGRYYLAWSVVLLALGVHTVVISQPLLAIGPKLSAEARPGYLGAVVVQQIVVAAGAAVLLLVGLSVGRALFPDKILGGYALPVAAVTLAFVSQEFVRRYLFMVQRASAAILVDAVTYGGQLVMIVISNLIFGLNSIWVLWAIAVAFSAGFGAGLAMFSGRIALERGALRSIARRHWDLYKWMLPGTGFVWLNTFIFPLAVGDLMGSAAVGGLRVGYMLIGAAHVLLLGLENSVPVQASLRLKHQGTQAMIAFLRWIAIVGVSMVSLLAIVAALAPSLWITLVFGAAYEPYAHLLVWYGLSMIVTFPLLPLRAGLRSLERTRPILFSTGLSTLVGVALAYPLVKAFGLVGAPIGTTIISLVDLAVMLYYFSRYTGWLRHR